MDGQEAVTHMLTVCGLTLGQRNIVRKVKGTQYTGAVAAIYLGDVKQMTENLSRLALGRGKYIGMSATAKIKALIWWVQYAHTGQRPWIYTEGAGADNAEMADAPVVYNPVSVATHRTDGTDTIPRI
jgi:hypothetical protein